MLAATDIHIESILDGSLTHDFPEFYQLKTVIENNGGHASQSVFDHSIESVEALEDLVAELSPTLKAKLEEPVGNVTRGTILTIATLFHDIGKLNEEANERGAFVHHDVLGAELVQTTVLKHIDLEPVARVRFVELIAHHLVLHYMSDDKESLDENMKKFFIEYEDIALELILLVLADLRGSNLPELNPSIYIFKDRYFKNILKN